MTVRTTRKTPQQMHICETTEAETFSTRLANDSRKSPTLIAGTMAAALAATH